MFALYRESAAFRQQTAQLADEGSPCLHVEKRGGFPFSTYRVLVDTCELDVSTNIAGASVTAGDAQTESVPVESADGADGRRAIRRTLRTLCAQKQNSTHSTPGFMIWIFPTRRAPVRILKSRRPSTSCSRRSSHSISTTRACTSGTARASALTSRSTARITQRFQPVSSLQLSPLHADSVVTASCKTDAGRSAHRQRTGGRTGRLMVLFSFRYSRCLQ